MLTCILEAAVALGMKMREKRVFVLILLVNLLTNPLANLCYHGMALQTGRIVGYREWSVAELFVQYTGYDPVWILIEILVVFGEGGIYMKFREWIPHPWKYAVIANLVSAVAGVCWYWVK